MVTCKELTSHPAGVARFVSIPNTKNTAGLQAIYHSLSTDHIPWLFQGPYTTVCPKNAYPSLSKDQILQATYHGLSKDHIPWLVQRPHTMTCPKTTHHGLSTGYLPWLVQRPHSNRACPKTTYQLGLYKDHIPIGLVQRMHTMAYSKATY